MWYTIRQIFLKGGDIKDAIHYIFKKTGNMPTKSEGMKIIKMYQDIQKDTAKIFQFPKDRITPFHIPRPTKATPFSFPQTPQEKIDWLVKNVDPSAKQTIPPRGTLEAMLKDGREDLIDHFFEMHTKELGKPKINIDTSDLKHPELVKKMMTDEKLKPTLVKDKTLLKDSPEAIAKIKAENKAAAERLRKKKEAEELFTDERPPKDPDFASGGIARVGYRFGSRGPGAQVQEDKRIKELMEEGFKSLMDKSIKSTPEGVLTEQIYPDSDAMTLDRPSKPEIITEAYDPYAPDSPTAMTIHPKAVEYDDGTVYFKDTGKFYRMEDGTQVEGPSPGAKPVPKTLEAAEGGIARVGYFKGGKVWKEFIEKLFIKTSNDIRQGKGKWAGLTQDQWIKQHDDLTKMLKKWEWGGKKGLSQGAEQFIGMNDLQVTKAIKGATKKVDDEKLMQKAYDEIYGGSGFSGDYKYDADILAEEYARQHGKVFADLPEKEISKYYDPALKRVSQDMLKRREAQKALKDVEQKIELQMFDTKGRKPNAYGGIAGELHLNQGGRVSFVKGGKVSNGLAQVLGV